MSHKIHESLVLAIAKEVIEQGTLVIEDRDDDSDPIYPPSITGEPGTFPSWVLKDFATGVTWTLSYAVTGTFLVLEGIDETEMHSSNDKIENPILLFRFRESLETGNQRLHRTIKGLQEELILEFGLPREIAEEATTITAFGDLMIQHEIPVQEALEELLINLELGDRDDFTEVMQTIIRIVNR